MKPARLPILPMIAIALLVLSPQLLVGCDEQGPAEQAGEKLDELGKDTKRAVEDAAD